MAEGGRSGYWNTRLLVDEPIIRLILDGTVVRVGLDRKATAIVLLVVLGVRDDGQKVLLAAKTWAARPARRGVPVLDDLVKRGLRKPEFLITSPPMFHPCGAKRCRRSNPYCSIDLIARSKAPQAMTFEKVKWRGSP